MGLNEEVGGREEGLARSMYSAVSVSGVRAIGIQGHNSWREKGDTGRAGGEKTLNELCDPVDPTPEGEGRGGDLDARLGAPDTRPE